MNRNLCLAGLSFLLACAAGFAAEQKADCTALHSEANLLIHSNNRLLHLKPNNRNGSVAKNGTEVNAEFNGNGEVRAWLPLRKEWNLLLVELEMRTEDVVRGKESWQDAGLAFWFLKPDGKRAGDWPRTIRKTGTSDWQSFRQIYRVPADASALTFAVGNWGNKGKASFRKLKVTPLSSKEMPPVEPFDTKRLWNFDDAERTVTATRERICLNGIWQFQPAVKNGSSLPAEFKYYFKVPGIWPGFDGWGQAGSFQRIYNPDGTDSKLDGKTVNRAWYRRSISIPAHWNDRKILLELSYLQIFAQVFIDGKETGSIAFPGGALDLTGSIRPGKTHDLVILLTAQPEGLKEVSYSDINRMHIKDKKVTRRGINGDVWLRAEPSGARISDMHVITSTSNGTITFDTGFLGRLPEGCSLEVRISNGGREIKRFHSGTVTEHRRRFRFTEKWIAPELWDPEHPQNLYTASVSLKDASGKIIDTLYPEEFGFREFSISGRNFLLNGKVIRLQITPSLFPWYGAGPNIPENFRHNAELMRRCGLNFCYALNYNFSPGDVCYQDAFYKEYSRNGILTALTLPNPVLYNFDTPEEVKAYTACTEYLIRRFQNVPGVVMYASTHNSSGWGDSDNPVRLGSGIPGTYAWNPQNNITAQKADRIVNSLDPARPHYRHSSGISGSPLITLNCYLNWMPLQERRDYLELWSKQSHLPLVFVEYGIPHLPSWTSYRGPGFIWSGPQVMSVWLNEYLAQYLGEKAYSIDGVQKIFLDSQAQTFGGKKVPVSRYTWMMKSPAVAGVQAMMLRETIPSFRGHGLSGMAFWDHYQFWEGGSGITVLNDGRFRNLKRTGISPDYILHGPLDFGSQETTVGKAVQEANRPLLGLIAGKPGDFTGRNSYFLRRETIRKTLMLLNDTLHRETIQYTCTVSGLNLKKEGTETLEPGERKFVRIDFPVPPDAPDALELKARFVYSNGQTEDTFRFTIGNRRTAKLKSPLYCFDPEGGARKLLAELSLPIRSGTPATGSILIIGRNALEKSPYNLGKLAASGVKLLILEQTHSVLWNRLGIRSTEYGLRKLFPIVPEFSGKPLSDWRGASTLKAPYDRRREWVGIPIWGNIQAGYRGAVSTVVPEKPCIGDWMPLVHGGFNLSYAPLLEFKEGNIRILFSQLDLSNRTEHSPEALELLASALEYLERSPAKQERRTFYSGGAEGRNVLDTLKIKYETNGKYGADDLLIIAPGFSPEGCREAVARGANLLALGLDKAAIDKLIPGKNGAGVWKNTYSHPAGNLTENPFFRGISNADLFWRKPLTGTFFDGGSGPALKHFSLGKGNMVFVQVVPWMFEEKEFQLRITRRRNFALISRIAHNMGAKAESGLPDALATSSRLILDDWYGKADPDRKGYRLFGSKFGSDWRKVKIAAPFDTPQNGLDGYDGDFFYRTVFDLPQIPQKGIVLDLGVIDDFSWVWLNGKFLGEVTDKTNPADYWMTARKYTLTPRMLRKKGNTLTVLCRDLRGNGGILGTPRLIFGSADYNLYSDVPDKQDDPYRYFHW